MPRTRPTAQCHPDRPHLAKGWCRQCYQRTDAYRATKRATYALKRNPELSPPRGERDGAKPPQVAIPAGLEEAGRSVRTDAAGEVSGAWSLQRRAGADTPPVPVPDSHHLKSTAILQRGDGSITQQWTSWDHAAVERDAEARAAIEAFFEKVRTPTARRAAKPRQNMRKDLHVRISLGDPHINLLSWWRETGANQNLEIAEEELVKCAEILVHDSLPSYSCDITNLGDFLHAEDSRNRTPASGNQLDADSRPGKVGEVGLRILTAIIDAALTKHQVVNFGSCPGNHDPTLTWWLNKCVELYYRNEPRVVVRRSEQHYQYSEFGLNLFGDTHGDGAKIEALPEIMASDVPEMWGRTRFHYFDTGHRHHLEVKDFRSCTVRTHRVVIAQDHWHYKSGYRSMRSLQSNTYHREYGWRRTDNAPWEMVRAALDRGQQKRKKGGPGFPDPVGWKR